VTRHEFRKWNDIRKWVGSADTTGARAARRFARLALRTRARIRSGSVAAEMDRIVAAANAGEIGSGKPHPGHPRASRSRSGGAPPPNPPGEAG
jgi:hypothetical protein